MCRVYGRGRDSYVRYCNKAHKQWRGAHEKLAFAPLNNRHTCVGCREKIAAATHEAYHALEVQHRAT